MGLEADCHCRWSDGAADVHVLLEAHELIVRGALRRRIALADLRDVRVEDAALCFADARGAYELALGADRAVRWAQRITAPPPSLARKLGAGPASKVCVIGALDDPALLEALGGLTTPGFADAAMGLAVVRDAASLQSALRAAPPRTPIWIVYEKGPKAAFGEAAVRGAMRAEGYRDTKVCAVSATLTAARYLPATPPGDPG